MQKHMLTLLVGVTCMSLHHGAEILYIETSEYFGALLELDMSGASDMNEVSDEDSKACWVKITNIGLRWTDTLLQ
jgi:hypothetical protein